jgi:hypothetical protein
MAGESLKSIGECYDISMQTVCDICKGRTWKD